MRVRRKLWARIAGIATRIPAAAEISVAAILADIMRRKAFFSMATPNDRAARIP
jgi:hypothetical protein